jgi:DNA-binding HxlR family transcriptional regulator
MVENTEKAQPLGPAEIPCWDVRNPIEFIWGLVGQKWAVLILRELLDGARRPCELLEELPGISSKTLMVRLKELERYGLLERQVYAEVPPRVEYALTRKGQELKPVLLALKQVGERWLQEGGCTLGSKGRSQAG